MRNRILAILRSLNPFAPEGIEVTKARFEILAIMLGGFFIVYKWGWEAQWARQESYVSGFYNTYDKDGKQTRNYLYSKPVSPEELGGADANYCRLEGTFYLKNKSAAPLYVQKAHIYLVEFNKYQCTTKTEEKAGRMRNNLQPDGSCIASNSASTVFQRVCRSSKDEKAWCENTSKTKDGRIHKITLYPVDEQPLFKDQSADRPFDVWVPSFDEGKGLLLVGEMEIGRWCGRLPWLACETSRAYVVDVNVCQNKQG